MRDLIKLVSTAGTGHYYTTDKNKKNTPDKMVFKKLFGIGKPKKTS